MLFWIFVAILTALVVLVFLWPFMRARPVVDGGPRESAIYRDQLKEIDTDLEQGLISASEAQNARAEIGRRLLAAVDAEAAAMPLTATGKRLFRPAELAIIAVLPLVAVGGYLVLGAPATPDQPLEMRLANPGNNMELLVAKAERFLHEHPEDGKGWDTLAPIYFRAGRYDDAEKALRNAIRLLGATPERLGGLAETLIGAKNGQISDDAEVVITAILKLDPKDPRAAYYHALHLEQLGKRDEARQAFEALAAASPKDAPWLEQVGRHIALLSGPEQSQQAPEAKAPQAQGPNAPGNPSADDIAAAQGMNAGDRQSMILQMVDGLEQKLKDNPANFEGWVRLIRSLGVLKQAPRGAAALQRAIAAFPADTDQGRQLIALAEQVGIPTDGVKK